MTASYPAFAADTKAEEPVVEEMTEAISEEELDMDSIMAELYAQLEELNIADLLTPETQEEDDSSWQELGDALDFVIQFLSDSEVRSSTIKYCLDSFADDMTEEEKQDMADKLANITMEDIEEAGSAIQEAFSGDELKEFLDEVEKIVNEKKELAIKESAEEIDGYLNELGQMLIDITPEDIISILQ